MTDNERKAAIHKIISSYEEEVEFSKSDLTVINTLNKWDYRKYKLVKNPNPNPEGKPCLCCLDKDWQIISWTKVGKRPDKYDIRAAFLSEILDLLPEPESKCELCNSTKDLSSRHKKVTFMVIVRSFLKSKTIPVDSFLENKHEANGYSFKYDNIADEWRKYYKENAVYYTLCPDCIAKVNITPKKERKTPPPPKNKTKSKISAKQNKHSHGKTKPLQSVGKFPSSKKEVFVFK